MKTQETAQSNTGGPGNRPRCKQARFERAVHWYKLNRRENRKSNRSSPNLLPFLWEPGERRRSLCLPKDTSSLGSPFLAARGLLAAGGARPRTGVLLLQTPAGGLVRLSDTPPAPLGGTGGKNR